MLVGKISYLSCWIMIESKRKRHALKSFSVDALIINNIQTFFFSSHSSMSASIFLQPLQFLFQRNFTYLFLLTFSPTLFSFHSLTHIYENFSIFHAYFSLITLNVNVFSIWIYNEFFHNFVFHWWWRWCRRCGIKMRWNLSTWLISYFIISIYFFFFPFTQN